MIDERTINACVPFYTQYMDIAYQQGIKQAREYLTTLPKRIAKGVDCIVVSMNFQAPKKAGG